MSLEWRTDSDIFIQLATIMDEERGDKTVLQALEEFKNKSDPNKYLPFTPLKPYTQMSNTPI